MLQKEPLQAVHANEVTAFFAGLGLLQELESGEIRCYHCADVLTAKSFRAATRFKGEIRFCCEKPACMMALASLGREIQ